MTLQPVCSWVLGLLQPRARAYWSGSPTTPVHGFLAAGGADVRIGPISLCVSGRWSFTPLGLYFSRALHNSEHRHSRPLFFGVEN